MIFSTILSLAVISVAVADVAHLGYNYEPPKDHSGYNYDEPAQGAPTELHSEYVAAEFQPAAATHYAHHVAPHHSSVKSGQIAATYESAASAPAPVHIQKVHAFKPVPASTHLHAVHQAAPVTNNFHESYESAPAASHQQSVLTSYDAPTFIDTNSLSVEASNDVGTVYGSNGGYVY